MKKKKLVSMLMAVVLVGAIGVGATLAYFTDKEAKTNVITMGHVDIDLDEPNYEGDEENNEVKDIVPGQTIVKDPTITVAEDSQDAYVRATLAFEDLSEEQIAQLMEGITINDGWKLSGDYYYYNAVVAAGESVTLFDEVVIPEKWGNEVADLTFKIIVGAEAIQADNFEPVTDDEGMITAWQYKDGTDVTADNYDAEELSGDSVEADGE